MTPSRHLLLTMTNEPFQPVRLYFSAPDRSAVVKRLRALKCMVDVPAERGWQWLFHAESASLRFPGVYEDVPKERRPIILGRIRFADRGSMTLETNSIPRAIEGARFFRRHLGRDVVALRCRVVNRYFAAEEGRPEELLRTLDRDVVVIDPRANEAAMQREIADLPPQPDAEALASAYLERRIKSKHDVPLVEDFPLAPEEETPEFHDLKFGLELRLVRALEHWNGNTDLTLTALIVRTAEQGMLSPSGRRKP